MDAAEDGNFTPEGVVRALSPALRPDMIPGTEQALRNGGSLAGHTPGNAKASLDRHRPHLFIRGEALKDFLDAILQQRPHAFTLCKANSSPVRVLA